MQKKNNNKRNCIKACPRKDLDSKKSWKIQFKQNYITGYYAVKFLLISVHFIQINYISKRVQRKCVQQISNPFDVDP